jgi:hypothetical protein
VAGSPVRQTARVTALAWRPPFPAISASADVSGLVTRSLNGNALILPIAIEQVVAKIPISEDPNAVTCCLKAGRGPGGYAAIALRFSGATMRIISWFPS